MGGGNAEPPGLNGAPAALGSACGGGAKSASALAGRSLAPLLAAAAVYSAPPSAGRHAGGCLAQPEHAPGGPGPSQVVNKLSIIVRLGSPFWALLSPRGLESRH